MESFVDARTGIGDVGGYRHGRIATRNAGKTTDVLVSVICKLHDMSLLLAQYRKAHLVVIWVMFIIMHCSGK